MDSIDTEKQESYFAELLAKIREIRSSEYSAQRKITEISALACDYDSKMRWHYPWTLWLEKIKEQGATERFANYLIMMAEAWAMSKTAMTMGNIENLGNEFLNSSRNSYCFFSVASTYENPSYQGEVFTIDGEEGYLETAVRLPEELKDFKGRSMVLKIEDMGRLIDTFCSLNTYYRRAYAIMADLDKKVMDCMTTGEFPSWISISYKEDGDALFEFSHFELDLREPDEAYRTLYVVYRYDTTAS